MPLTKTPPSMMDLAVEVPLTGVGRLRGASDTGDALTLVGGAANDNNRLQIRGGSHPTTQNTMTVDLGGGEALRFNAAGHLIGLPIPQGYGAGAGGAVTQATSKSTNVTLDKPVGRITMHNAALAANTTVGFALNCSFIAATDIILLTIVDASVSNGANYNVWASVGSGGALIKLRNVSAGSLSEAVQINYAVIKGATA